MGTPISNVDVIPLFLLQKLSSCEHGAETFAVTAQLSLSIATICFNRNVCFRAHFAKRDESPAS